MTLDGTEKAKPTFPKQGIGGLSAFVSDSSGSSLTCPARSMSCESRSTYSRAGSGAAMGSATSAPLFSRCRGCRTWIHTSRIPE